MTEVHQVKLTHQSADKILDALRDYAERYEDEQAAWVADVLLEAFDKQHR